MTSFGPRIRPLLVPAIFALGALAVLVSLGTWQLSRLAWKQELIAQVQERTRLPPVALPPREAWPHMSAESDEYRRVSVTGTFRHATEAYLYHVAGDTRQTDRSRPQGQGYFVMTPLVTAEGTTVERPAATTIRSSRCISRPWPRAVPMLSACPQAT